MANSIISFSKLDKKGIDNAIADFDIWDDCKVTTEDLDVLEDDKYFWDIIEWSKYWILYKRLATRGWIEKGNEAIPFEELSSTFNSILTQMKAIGHDAFEKLMPTELRHQTW